MGYASEAEHVLPERLRAAGFPSKGRRARSETISRMARARLILICGLPGSGKTTFAKELAPKVPAVRLSPDEWKHDLGIDYYDERRRVQLEHRLWRLAQELLTLGQSVILENGFWSREERDGLRLSARALGVAVELHYLEAPVEELWRRLQVRNDEARPGVVPIKREHLQRWALQFEAPDAAERALFDEAGLSAPSSRR
jgi:predicted kinase